MMKLPACRDGIDGAFYKTYENCFYNFSSYPIFKIQYGKISQIFDQGHRRKVCAHLPGNGNRVGPHGSAGIDGAIF
jgi:hypothetical protein